MAARSKWSRGDDRESIRLFVLRGPRLFNHQKPLRVVVAGPCGCGKTTIGKELAVVLGLPFIEGDDLHPAENVAKMKRGEPLDDADRAPWLALVKAAVGASREGAVASCSALKQIYRDALGPVRIVLLDVPEAVARERVERRSGHYMPASLVASQYEALELPAEECRTLVFDGTLAPAAMASTDSGKDRDVPTTNPTMKMAGPHAPRSPRAISRSASRGWTTSIQIHAPAAMKAIVPITLSTIPHHR